jgi:hypothetical protein
LAQIIEHASPWLHRVNDYDGLLGATTLVKRSHIETEWCCATADHKAQQSAQFSIATPARWKNIILK